MVTSTVAASVAVVPVPLPVTIGKCLTWTRFRSPSKEPRVTAPASLMLTTARPASSSCTTRWSTVELDPRTSSSPFCTRISDPVPTIMGMRRPAARPRTGSSNLVWV